ncbi:MAG: hypothetical protein LQ348_005992 [Seirophora lacunosa]|nr:MAG: hypothetical protein LQ348_005992 [Seirophora lacunosa]
MSATSSNAVIGYVDPLVCSPGDKPAVKVSCGRSSFTSQVLRLGTGYQHPDGPPVNHRPVELIPKQTHHGKPQFSRTGSFLRVESWTGHALSDVDFISISLWCQATLPTGAGHEQYLFSSIDTNKTASGFECLLNESGDLIVRVGTSDDIQEVKLSTRLVRHQWYHLRLTIEPSPGIIRLRARTKARDIGELSALFEEEHRLPRPAQIKADKPFTIAGDSCGNEPSRQPVKSSSFNGKIDGFKVETLSNGTLATLLDFNFSLDIPTDKVRDVGNQHHGDLINAPSRAVTGHDWDASQSDWTRASYGYGAIHFHDDDLDDAMWETSFELELPDNLHSGCYGVFVDDGESTDIIPFFVRPDPKAAEVPMVALIIPTFTYAAYANEHLYDESRTVSFPGDTSKLDTHFQTLVKRPDLGISLYDSHNDGSGTVFSTLKRPVLNMRPDYSMWLFDGAREFPADLWFVEFLDRELGSDAYDVITDHDISASGASLLNRYKVLMSCSHPEYPTSGMLDAYSAFLAGGGHFMYLGGNGYYWATTHDPSRPHRIEVRRAEAGCRTFGLPPGNWHHSLTGEPGGLWRSRGRPPNRIFGVGSCAMGIGKGAGYGITPEARQDARLGPILRGLDSGGVIGDFGLVQGAASGDEIDRLDYGLGTPGNAVVVATTKLAGGHSDQYMLFNEETLFPMVNTTGTTSEKIRSDVVYFETGGGGAVFSVGSINWVGAMAWKGFENDVARMTANVLGEFVRRSRVEMEKKKKKRDLVDGENGG